MKKAVGFALLMISMGGAWIMSEARVAGTRAGHGITVAVDPSAGGALTMTGASIGADAPGIAGDSEGSTVG